MVDILIALEKLVPDAEFIGSTTQGTQEEYDELLWNDAVTKPLWDDIVRTSNDELLSNTKLAKIEELKELFDIDQALPVTTTVNGEQVQWTGGWISGIKLDAAWRLSMIFNQPSVTFHNIDGNSYILSHKDAETVIKMVGYSYERLFQKKNTLIKKVNAITIDSGNSIDDVIDQINNISW